MDDDEIKLDQSTPCRVDGHRRGRARVESEDSDDATEAYYMNTFRSVSPFENELGNHMLEHLREALPLTTTYPTDISSDFCVEQERVSLNKTRVVQWGAYS